MAKESKGSVLAEMVHLAAHQSWNETAMAVHPMDPAQRELMENVYVAGYLRAAEHFIRAHRETQQCGG